MGHLKRLRWRFYRHLDLVLGKIPHLGAPLSAQPLAMGWSAPCCTVAKIYASLPAEEQAVTGILTGNYGEAGAINLYGPAYGLPQAISGMNSYWLRGFGDPPPQTVIVLGIDAHQAFILALWVAGTCLRLRL